MPYRCAIIDRNASSKHTTPVLRGLGINRNAQLVKVLYVRCTLHPQRRECNVAAELNLDVLDVINLKHRVSRPGHVGRVFKNQLIDVFDRCDGRRQVHQRRAVFFQRNHFATSCTVARAELTAAPPTLNNPSKPTAPTINPSANTTAYFIACSCNVCLYYTAHAVACQLLHALVTG